ncbi:MAG: GNAT family N-acetyltransferase [Acidobacteriota bacterium]
MSSPLFAEHSLSRRLERAEGCANAAFVEARAKIEPGSGAEWRDFGGTYAMFDTPDSPVTQTFGLGMFGAVTAAGLDEAEAFFRHRGAPVHHEISPLADKSVWPLIFDRRYRPLEFTSLLFLELRNVAPPEGAATPVRVRVANAAEAALWAATAAHGWNGDHPEMAEALDPLMRTVFHVAGVTHFFAERDGRPVGTAALNIQNGVALLAGASTIPEARRQGAQRALLAARLQFAAEAGCDLATMGAEPGSASQRNAERAGFRIAYTRTKWCLPTSPPFADTV